MNVDIVRVTSSDFVDRKSEVIRRRTSQFICTTSIDPQQMTNNNRFTQIARMIGQTKITPKSHRFLWNNSRCEKQFHSLQTAIIYFRNQFLYRLVHGTKIEKNQMEIIFPISLMSFAIHAKLIIAQFRYQRLSINIPTSGLSLIHIWRCRRRG